MASKPAAVGADASATAGSMNYPPATSGTWTPGPVTTKSYPKLTVAGAAVIYEASCTFAFAGFTSSTPPVPVSGTEDVTLTASTTKLQKNEHSVLRDGDSQTGTYGNKVSVSASGKLKSA